MPHAVAQSASQLDLYTPSEEMALLRETVRKFTAAEVEPQALEYERAERFNRPLFKRLGDLGLLGITVPEAYGGAGLDAVAAVLVHEELSASDPGLCLSYLAHAMLFVNNFFQNASDPQRSSGDKRSMMGRACNPISTNASTLTTKTAVSHTE